jgi:cytochrome c-type biogenesis protein CcmF
MLPEIGNFLLLSSIFVGAFAAYSPNKRNTYILFTAILSSYLVLIYAFIISDFSVVNVYLNSSTIKPLIYKISAAWASHEGSIMFFTLTLAFVNLFLNSNRFLSPIIMGFLIIIYFTSTPFGRLLNPPIEGLGLNPSLQDPALAIHPPILYLGYALYAVPYSIIMHALWNKEELHGTLSKLKTFSSFAFGILTTGVGLGSWWAYRELGWGGYWFFDPVENTSLIIWVMGAIFHHMIILARREQKYLNLTALIGILIFSLCLLGTFLVRSGILMSIHSFAFDKARGAAIFTLFSITSLSSLWLFGIRNKKPGIIQISAIKNQIFFLSLMMLLIADIFLIVATLYPPFLKLYSGSEVAVDISYYIKIFIPFSLLGITFAPIVLSKIFVPGFFKHHAALCISAILSLVIAFHYSKSIISGLAIFSGLNLIGWSIIYSRTKKIHVIIGHFGLGLFISSITFNTIFKETSEFIGKLDHKIQFRNYEIELFDIKYAKSENYVRQIAKFKVTDLKENRIFSLMPEQRLYMLEKMTKSKPHIDMSLESDLYAVLLNVRDNEVHAEFHHNPAIFLLWFSIFLMALSFTLPHLGSVKKNLY